MGQSQEMLDLGRQEMPCHTVNVPVDFYHLVI